MSTDTLTALRALGDEARLATARLLAEGPFSVGEVQEVLGLGQSTASRNLKILADAGLVQCRREGREAWYRFSDAADPVVEALRRLVVERVPLADEDGRRRLHGVYEERRLRSVRHFAALSLSDPRRTKALRLAPIAPDIERLMPAKGLVADLGTGSGRVLPMLAGPGRRVIGVDASPHMLEQAAGYVRENGTRGIELRLGTLEHLPFADGELDGALVNEVLHHAAQPEFVLREIHRVLAPGGRLVVVDYLPHDREWMREELADLWLGFDPDEIARMLVRSGFEVVSRRQDPPVSELGVFVVAADRCPSPDDSKDRKQHDAASKGRGEKQMPSASTGARRVRA